MSHHHPSNLDGYTLATCRQCEMVVSVLDNIPVDLDLHKARIRPHRCDPDDIDDAQGRKVWRQVTLDMRDLGYEILVGEDAINALLDRMESYLIR